jgi:GDP-L-fucose synthase
MADACVHIMEKVDAQTLYDELKQTHINIGTGIDLTIKELADIVKEVVGFQGEICWDATKPDGTHKKQLDVSLLKQLKWEHRITLEQGIAMVYENYG